MKKNILIIMLCVCNIIYAQHSTEVELNECNRISNSDKMLLSKFFNLGNEFIETICSVVNTSIDNNLFSKGKNLEKKNFVMVKFGFADSLHVPFVLSTIDRWYESDDSILKGVLYGTDFNIIILDYNTIPLRLYNEELLKPFDTDKMLYVKMEDMLIGLYNYENGVVKSQDVIIIDDTE